MDERYAFGLTRVCISISECFCTIQDVCAVGLSKIDCILVVVLRLAARATALLGDTKIPYSRTLRCKLPVPWSGDFFENSSIQVGILTFVDMNVQTAGFDTSAHVNFVMNCNTPRQFGLTCPFNALTIMWWCYGVSSLDELQHHLEQNAKKMGSWSPTQAGPI